jgi:hypothetical protein
MLDYLNIKEYPKDKGIILDSCNSEERLYHNGCYYDLCGMSVQDYINSTLLNCSGSGGNDTPEEVIKTLNTIIFSKNSNGNLVVYPNKAPKTDIKVSFTCEIVSTTITLPANSTSVVNTNYTPTNEELVVNNVKIEPAEDDLYKYGDYKIEKEEIMKEHTIYYDMVNTLTSNNLSKNDVEKFTSVNITVDEQEITYMLPAAPEGVEDLPEDEYLEWEENNSYQKSLVVPTELYTSNDNRKFNYLLNGVDAFIGFENVKSITIDNEQYYILVDKDDRVTNSSTQKITAGTYKLSLRE